MIRMAAFTLSLTLFFPILSYAQDKPSLLSVNTGKCGSLQGANVGEETFKDCKIGDVIIVPRKTMPMFCDFRYQIVEYDRGAGGPSYACVLRTTYENRKN